MSIQNNGGAEVAAAAGEAVLTAGDSTASAEKITFCVTRPDWIGKLLLDLVPSSTFKAHYDSISRFYDVEAGDMHYAFGDKWIDPASTLEEIGIKAGAVVRLYDHRSLTKALKSRDEQTARGLLRLDADPDAKEDSDGVAPLLIACETGSERMAMTLIKSCKDLGALDTHGRSALLLCCTSGYEKAALLLLRKGADPNLGAEADGMTPLLTCCDVGSEAVALELLDRGADVKARNSSNQKTALHYAVMKNADRLIPRLLQAGAEIDAVDTDGNSPLHIACQEGCELAARMLVAAGADIRLRNKAGKTPISLAKWVHTWPDKSGSERRYDHGYGRWRELFNLSRALRERAAAKAMAPAQKESPAEAPPAKRRRLGTGADNPAKRAAAPHTDPDVFARVLCFAVQNGYGDDVFNAGFCCKGTYEDEDLWRAFSVQKVKNLSHIRNRPFQVEGGRAPNPTRTALMAATRFGNASRVEWLLKLGARVAFREGAVREKYHKEESGGSHVFALLVPVRGGSTALHHAAANGHRVVVQMLLKAGANPDDTRADGMRPLLLAARGGFSSIVELLLKAGAQPDSTQPRSRVTSLHIAAYKGNVTMVRRLLKHNANPVAASKQCKRTGGYAPLHSAIAKRQLPVLNLLAQQPGALDFQGSRTERSPLQFSILRQQFDAAAILLRLGAAVNTFDREGSSELHLISRRASDKEEKDEFDPDLIMLSKHRPCSTDRTTRAELVSMLLAAGANVNARVRCKMGRPPLELAAGAGFEDVALLLLDAGANPKCRNVLAAACGSGSRSLVARLLKEGASPLLNGKSSAGRSEYPLEAAASSGNQALVEDLLRAGVDINQSDALSAAARGGRTALGHWLLSKGALPTVEALEMCCMKGVEELGVTIARALGTVEAYMLEYARKQGKHALARKLLVLVSTAELHTACEASDEATVNALVASGADCSAIDLDGLSPLQRALLADKPSEAVVAALLKAGADIEAKSSKAETPLYIACEKSLTTIAMLLLEAGANPRASRPQFLGDTIDGFGTMPLHECVRRSNVELAAKLLAKGADPLDGYETQVFTPLQLARRRRGIDPAMINLLVAALNGRQEPAPRF